MKALTELGAHKSRVRGRADARVQGFVSTGRCLPKPVETKQMSAGSSRRIVRLVESSSRSVEVAQTVDSSCSEALQSIGTVQALYRFK